MNASPEHILARLHLNAVLPCLAPLIRLDECSRALVARRRFGVRLKTRSGLSSRLDFLDGEVRIDGCQDDCKVLELLFLSDRQLNRSFSGSGFSVPIPMRGFFQLTRVRAFTRLTARLQHILSASPRRIIEHGLLGVHVDLLLGQLIPSAIVQLAQFDGPSMRVLEPYRGRVARIEVNGGVSGRIDLNGDGAARVEGSDFGTPDVTISFRDRHVALAAVHGELDNLAAIGRGELSVHGLIPLADALEEVMTRLSRLMKGPG